MEVSCHCIRRLKEKHRVPVWNDRVVCGNQSETKYISESQLTVSMFGHLKTNELSFKGETSRT